ncbi:MAG: hypothetical protein Q9160_000273 [Pyrenula sp. 1 TL-2023]
MSFHFPVQPTLRAVHEEERPVMLDVMINLKAADMAAGVADAFRIDGRSGQRSYYDDYGYGYDSNSQYDNLLGNVASDETFQDVMAKGCWWVVKAQFERLKQEALVSAKRHFQDYVNRVAQHGGHWLFET